MKTSFYNMLMGSAALAMAVVAVPDLARAQTVGAQSSAQSLAQSAYEALAQNRATDAVTAAEQAVTASPENAEWRLLLVDAYLQAERPADALTALQSLSARDDYAVQSRLAQAAAAAGQADVALRAYARAAVVAPDAVSRAYLTRSHIAALVKVDKNDEARVAFGAALESGALTGSEPLDLANLALSVGDDVTAHAAFQQADAIRKLSGASALDAAYNARRLEKDADAVRYFQQGLDSAYAGEIKLEPQPMFDIRREVSTLERRWGASGLVGRGVSAVAPGVAAGQGDGVVQAGGEVYYRLGGYRSGRPIEAFARAFQTLDTDTGDATGFDTTQAWLGVRWKPLAETNLILEGSRMVAVGDYARNDWMVRAAWSADEGSDLRVDRTSWPMWRVYTDLAHIIDDSQTIALIDARAGRSFRVTERGVLTPYAVIRADYDDSLMNKEALGAGVGLSWRQWYRETRYSAPSSYVDLSLEYRARLSGDDRAEGLFATLSFSY